jgi:hypothetical protein
MTPDDRDHLLRELLGDDSLENLRRDSLAAGLVALRARRRRRAVLAGASAAAVLLLAFALAWPGHPAGDPTANGDATPPSRLLAAVAEADPTATGATRLQPEAAPAEISPDTADNGVQLITDEELFALFPGRSMALIGPPGAQQFLFLGDQSALEN